MKRALFPLRGLLGLIIVALVSSNGHSESAKLDARKPDTRLPDAVAKALKAKFPKAKSTELEVEDENGVTIYDLEFKDEGIDKETDIAADGTMLEFSLVVAADAVPAPAMKAIRAAAEGATIERLEHAVISYETKDGKTIKLPEPQNQYEAEMTTGEQRGEITVASDGKVVEPAKWFNAKGEEDKDDK